MTLQGKIERIGAALVEKVGRNVYHYWRSNITPPFCVWAEDGEDSAFDADNEKGEQAISGYVDYYTKTEYDPTIDLIQDALRDITGVAFGWRLESVQYEEDTNLIHYSWTWSVS